MTIVNIKDEKIKELGRITNSLNLEIRDLNNLVDVLTNQVKKEKHRLDKRNVEFEQLKKELRKILELQDDITQNFILEIKKLLLEYKGVDFLPVHYLFEVYRNCFDDLNIDF